MVANCNEGGIVMRKKIKGTQNARSWDNLGKYCFEISFSSSSFTTTIPMKAFGKKNNSTQQWLF